MTQAEKCKEEARIEQIETSTAPESSVDTRHWYRSPNLRTLNLLMLIPMLSIFTLGFDGAMMNGLQAVRQWREYFNNPTGSTLGLFNGAYPIGGLIALPFVAAMSDRYGRRAGIAVGAIISCIAAVLQGAATGSLMFIIGRGVMGTGSVLILASGGPLVAELAHPNQRTTATALCGTSYGIGSVVAAWTTFGTFRIRGDASWRIPSALQALPSVIQLAGIYFVPESPRFYISRNRESEALAFLTKYHAEGRSNDPLALHTYNTISKTLALELSTPPHGSQQGTPKDTATNSYLSFLRTPPNRHRLVILISCACISQCSGNALISYYLPPILSLAGLTSPWQQTLIQATSQLLAWISAVYCATLPAKFGRRPLFMWSLAGIWACLAAIAIGSALFATSPSTNKNTAAGYAVVAFIYLYAPAFVLGWGGNMGLYLTEILPYGLRMRGAAVFLFWSLGFIALSVFAVPVGLEKLGWKAYCVFLGWVMVEAGVVWWLFPETKGLGLEECRVVFEGRGSLGDGGQEQVADGIEGNQVTGRESNGRRILNGGEGRLNAGEGDQKEGEGEVESRHHAERGETRSI